MRALCLALFLTVMASPVWANSRVTILMDVLKVSQVVEILRAEGLAYAAVLDQDMLGGQGGPFWQEQVSGIYDVQRISERLRKALETEMDADDIEAAIDFFGSDLGRQIVDQENAARRAMMDPDLEQAALDFYAESVTAQDPMTGLIVTFIAANDLLDRNVSGAMSSNFQFYKGLSDGRYTSQSEADILNDVWEQEAEIREDTDGWLNGFLFMAYQSLSVEALQQYIDYSTSPEGQALNAALFDGFEAVYRDVSYGLGRAVALNAKVDDI